MNFWNDDFQRVRRPFDLTSFVLFFFISSSCIIFPCWNRISFSHAVWSALQPIRMPEPKTKMRQNKNKNTHTNNSFWEGKFKCLYTFKFIIINSVHLLLLCTILSTLVNSVVVVVVVDIVIILVALVNVHTPYAYTHSSVVFSIAMFYIFIALSSEFVGSIEVVSISF